MQHVLCLSGEGKTRLRKELSELIAAGVLPSIAGDIWSENGLSILGITVYFINDDWVMVERLVDAVPFGTVAHTGVNIERQTKMSLAAVGIGAFKEDEDVGEGQLPKVIEDTTSDFVHTKVSVNFHSFTSFIFLTPLRTLCTPR